MTKAQVWAIIALFAVALVAFVIGRHPGSIGDQAEATMPVATSSAGEEGQSWSHKLDCASEMNQFQSRVDAQEKSTDPHSSVYDFFIAFSPSLNTCVGGYTKYLNYQFTGNGSNLYIFEIEDALTGVNIDSFQGYGADSQNAWVQYKDRFSALTSGAIPPPAQ